MKKFGLLCISFVISLGIFKMPVETINTPEIDDLFEFMQGSFSSAKQAGRDSTYFNISLHMYPIWKDKGYFLYVEQALFEQQDQPYRQRVYELKKVSDSVFSSTVYNLDIDSLWVGKWKTPEAFDTLDLSDLSLKDGCEVVLKQINVDHYKGSTGDTSCLSSLRGATYARSEVEIFRDKIISWDRGFDADGNHVWGAEKGGYIFDKLN